MDRRETPEATAVIPTDRLSEAAAVATGPAVGKALEKIALRDLRERMRATYRQENAEDEARIDALRHERNVEVEALDQKAWDVNRTYQMDQAEQRVPWIDARERTVEAKRAARLALAASREAENPADRATIEGLRVAHRAAQEGFDEERRVLDLSRESALGALRDRWNDARGRSIDAKRALEQKLKDVPRADKERAARVDAGVRDLRDLSDASAVCWQEVRRASIAHAKAAAQLRSAPHDNTLRAQVDSLAAAVGQLEKEARAADAAFAEALVSPALGTEYADVHTEARLRAELLDARDEEALEKRRSRRAVRNHRAKHRDAERAASEDLRHRRNAEAEAYGDAVNAVYTARGHREAQIRLERIDCRYEEHLANAQAKADNRAYREREGATRRAALEDLRQKKVAAKERFSSAVESINRTRGIERAEDRAQARTAAQQALAAFVPQTAAAPAAASPTTETVGA